LHENAKKAKLSLDNIMDLEEKIEEETGELDE